MATNSRGRVVVVNDDPGVLALYRDVLDELQYEPIPMIDDVEPEQIRQAEPDAVILDLQVGQRVEFGVEMARDLRSHRQLAAIPIIVCTANATALDGARRALRELNVPLLLKPFSVEEIGRVLERPPQ